MLISFASFHVGYTSALRRWLLILLPLLLVACIGRVAQADEQSPYVAEEHRSGIAAMVGLGQWVLGGANVAVQARIGRVALEYSHGQAVPLNASFLLNRSEKDAGADVHMQWTTGFGAGLAITDNLRVLVEFKAHRYTLQGGDRRDALAYTVFTIGPGVFYEVRLWRGLFVQPSIRYWPTVHSTLPAGATLARADGTRVPITSHDSGVFPNVNLGWEF